MSDNPSMPIGVYYYRYPNFGDMLNEVILQELLEIDAQHESFESADMSGIGSIVDKLILGGKIGKKEREHQALAQKDKPIHIWGTGFMHRYDPPENSFIRPPVFHALRGELSRRQASEMTGKQVSCVLADPGLLAPLVVAKEDAVWDVGIIPHYVDAAHPVFEKMAQAYPNSVVINVRQSTKDVLRQISQCRRVLSTSLHGIIASDAYGIPNCWCEASDKILGSGFKYHDYFSSFGTDRQPFDLRTGDIPDPAQVCRTTFSSYRQVRKKQYALLRSFPFFDRLSWKKRAGIYLHLL